MQRTRVHQTQNPEAAGRPPSGTGPTWRCSVASACCLGSLGILVFLFRLHFLTQTWYYVEMLCLCAISLDGMLGANWPALRPWGLLRIGFMVVMMTWSAKAGWAEAHTRRSNVDLIAAVLSQNAVGRRPDRGADAWEGITFNRYYHGPAHWVTVPPIDSHQVHRNDLVLEKMNQPEPMVPVLREMTDTSAQRS